MTEDSTTRPTIETVLEKVNLFGERLDLRLASVDSNLGNLRAGVEGIEDHMHGIEARMEKVESELSQLRLDINTRFRRVERKIDLLNRDFLSIRGDNEDLLQRVEDLESKAS
ncbi:MAG TPA: hypothetical protein VJQ56_13555 [Blastocatellia bacterium]|nr:hypothetical protein [Blastocatellia bacterium]